MLLVLLNINIFSVGYDVRSELLEVEYYHANIPEGDCIYIPFEWYISDITFYQLVKQARGFKISDNESVP